MKRSIHTHATSTSFYYDVSYRIGRAYGEIFKAGERIGSGKRGTVCPIVRAFGRYLALEISLGWNPIMHFRFWREVVTRGPSATIESGLAGMVNGLADEIEPE